MHNKRIGRDDLLKIEVSNLCFSILMYLELTISSGPALLHLHPGDLIPAVTAAGTVLPLAVPALHHPDEPAASYLPARMNVAIVITRDVTATARGVLMTVSGIGIAT